MRVWCFLISWGSKVFSRSFGVFSFISPSSHNTVLTSSHYGCLSLFWAYFSHTRVGQSARVECRFDGEFRQHTGKLIEVSFGFKALSQFSRECFKFLFVHNLPVSVVGVNISKTGNYTILTTLLVLKNL